MVTATPHNPYLEGLFAPVIEETTAVELTVVGELPSELMGMYVQNAPNPRYEPQGLYHWFDGDGMVHAVELRDGKATYRNRYVRTRAFQEEGQEGRAMSAGIMMPFDPAQPGSADKDTANTDLIWHGGRLLALWWLGGQPYALSVPDLVTQEAVDFGGTLTSGIAAHPKVDPLTGEMMFFDFSLYAAPYLRYGVASSEGRVTHETVIDLPGPSLLHDIAITKQFTIFMDFPMTWDRAKLLEGKRRVRFNAEHPSRFGLLKRHAPGSEVRWFEVPACYSYHTINAWEQQNASGEAEVVLLGCRIEDPMPRLPVEDEPDVPRLSFLRLEPYLTRWTFNLDTGAVTEEQLDDVATEFPRINEDRLGQRSHIAYNPRLARESTLLFDAIVKYDTDTGASTTFEHGQDRFASESTFAKRDGATDEDDGWLIHFVHDRREGTSELAVLDARDIAAGPVATVKIPCRVPVGFHAHWVPAEGLVQQNRSV
jgi:carotenoid cleavage dioxygenase-like enzyme